MLRYGVHLFSEDRVYCIRGPPFGAQTLSKYIYVWGSLRVSANSQPTITISALGCNDSIEAINVKASFSVLDLRIGQCHGPIPIESTARKLDEDFDFSNSPVYKFWDRIKDNDEYTNPSSYLDDFAKILCDFTIWHTGC